MGVELGLILEEGGHLRMDERRMRIQRGEHALERVVHEAVVGQLVEVGMAGADLFEDLDKALDCRVGGFIGVRQCGGGEREGQEKRKEAHDRSGVAGNERAAGRREDVSRNMGRRTCLVKSEALREAVGPFLRKKIH